MGKVSDQEAENALTQSLNLAVKVVDRRTLIPLNASRGVVISVSTVCFLMIERLRLIGSAYKSKYLIFLTPLNTDTVKCKQRRCNLGKYWFFYD